MNTVITKTVHTGDAGTPFSVTIDVEYEKEFNKIIVTDWMERESPYDNPPNVWYETMKEVIADFFYEQNEENQVVFHKD